MDAKPVIAMIAAASEARMSSSGGVERQLAAILAADIAGYSRLMDDLLTFGGLE